MHSINALGKSVTSRSAIQWTLIPFPLKTHQEKGGREASCDISCIFRTANGIISVFIHKLASWVL